MANRLILRLNVFENFILTGRTENAKVCFCQTHIRRHTHYRYRHHCPKANGTRFFSKDLTQLFLNKACYFLLSDTRHGHQRYEMQLDEFGYKYNN